MEVEKLVFLERMERILAKPFKILFHEPMLVAIVAYQSVRTIFPISAVLVFNVYSSLFMAACIFSSRRIR